MANEEFVVVSFPVLEYAEMRKYTHPTVVVTVEKKEDAERLAKESTELSLMYEDKDLAFTYEAMSREDFDKLEW